MCSLRHVTTPDFFLTHKIIQIDKAGRAWPDVYLTDAWKSIREMVLAISSEGVLKSGYYNLCPLSARAVKRREAKSKGEKERYNHLNAEFQRTARRDKKAFLSDQCKEIEENNRMGKTGDLFKKIRDTKGTFHAKMGSIKARNGRDHISRRY